MSVDSYLELFTTLFGWAFYGVLWDVLVSTGIVYLPFLGILIDNWREPAEGGEANPRTAHPAGPSHLLTPSSLPPLPPAVRRQLVLHEPLCPQPQRDLRLQRARKRQLVWRHLEPSSIPVITNS